MKVSEAMTRDVKTANPNQSIREAARLMAEIDAGAIPINENDRLVGMLTDRDIAVRAVAQGRGPDTRVQEVMSSKVLYCFADESVDDVSRNMGDVQVRRLPVVDRDKRLVGILSLGDLALRANTGDVGRALRWVCRPGGEHSQAPPDSWKWE